MLTQRQKINAIIEILHESSNEKSECASRIEIMYQHMLKCYFQPEMHTDSWDKSIINNYESVRDLDNKIIKGYINSRLTKIQNSSVHKALKDMNISKKDINKVISNEDKKKFFEEWGIDRLFDDRFLYDFFSSMPDDNNTGHKRRYIGKYT